MDRAKGMGNNRRSRRGRMSHISVWNGAWIRSLSQRSTSNVRQEQVMLARGTEYRICTWLDACAYRDARRELIGWINWLHCSFPHPGGIGACMPINWYIDFVVCGHMYTQEIVLAPGGGPTAADALWRHALAS